MKTLQRAGIVQRLVVRDIPFPFSPRALILILVILSSVLATVSSAEFKHGALLDNSVVVSSTLTPDRKTASIIFTNLSVQLSSSQKGPALVTKEISFRLPMDDTNNKLQLKQDLRGYVQCQPGVNVVALIRLGGATNIVNLCTSACQEGKEFIETLYVTLAPGTDYQGTIYLLLERNEINATQQAQLSIETIDIALVDADSPQQDVR